MSDTLTRSVHTLDLNDIVMVKNVAPRGHKFEHLTLSHGPRTVIQIDPGEIKPVPFYIVKNWLGDMRSREEATVVEAQTDLGTQKAVIPPREFELNRLHVLYGLHLTNAATFDDVMDEVPNVELFFDGNRLPSVIEDPEGKNVVNASQTVSEVEELRARVTQLEDLIESQRNDGDKKVTTLRPKSTRVVVPDPEDDTDQFQGTLPTDDVD